VQQAECTFWHTTYFLCEKAKIPMHLLTCVNLFQRVGCDWEVDSGAKEDRCGICHGDGSQCETQKGVYSKREGSGDYK
jgi:hypothetical protein